MIQQHWFENSCMRVRGVLLTRRQVTMIFERPSIVDNLIREERLHPYRHGKQERYDFEEVLRILPHFEAPRKEHSLAVV